MITTYFRTFLNSRTLRVGLIASGMAVALLAIGDRGVFSAPDPDTGIDPLDVLTTKTRPNVYLVLDSSSSMAQFSDFATVSAAKQTATEDEPNSKMAQAKAVLRQIVQDNQGIANFALARYSGTQATLPASDKFVYSTDEVDHPAITTTTALFDLRQFQLGATYTIPISEGGTNRTSASFSAATYNTGWDLAAAVQTALNGTVGKTNTYKVTFVDGPGGTDARFRISATNASPAAFSIRGTAMNATLRATLGFANADVSGTAQSVTPPSNGSTSYNLGTADAFTFTESGNTRNATLLASNYTTSALLAAGLQNALNAAAVNNTYSVAFTASRYVITTTSGGPVTFVINGGTFTNASRTALGFANANATSTSVAGNSVAAPNQPSGGEVALTARRDSTFNGSGRGRTGVANTEMDWIATDKFFSDMTLRIGPDGTPCAIAPAGTPSSTSAQIAVQPMTSCDPTASPTAVGTPFTFKFAGADWNSPPSACTGLDPLVGMGLCTNLTTQINDIGPYLEPSVKVSDTDPGPGVTPGIAGYTQTFLGAPTYASTPSGSLPEQRGIRMNAATPIAESFINIFKEYNTLWGSTIAAQPPGKRQKNFVIFLTDGDDTCETNSSAAASLNTSNLQQHAQRAAYAAQELYQGVDTVATAATRLPSPGTAASWPPAASARDPESRVTTFVVVFGGAVSSSNANLIAWGGSGMTQSSVTGTSFGTRWNVAPATSAGCSTCRDAFTASTAAALSTALQSAVNLTQEGEFSDQQSVTETVYEYVKMAPTPAPTVPATPTPAAQDPMNELSRYSRTVPVVLQSTFIMPNFQGHLTAFRNNGGTALELWDAGQKLKDRVVNGASGTDGMGTGEYNFATLRGTGTLANIKTSDTKIKRRIFTTTGNGKLTTEYAPLSLVDPAANLAGPTGFQRVPLWPPTAAGGVSPSDAANSAGVLDTALGLTAATDVAAVQALVADACNGAVAGDCVSATASVRLAKARREARELILAWLAGAEAVRDTVDAAVPKRVSNEIVYKARSWVMAESSLAAPAVVAPPPQAESTEFKRDEYLLYRDGPRKGTGTGDPCAPTAALSNTSCFSVNAFSSGLGLRNPDLDGSSVNGTFTAQNDPALKPLMSVVYHATNAALHAFRAGPCPSDAAYSPLGAVITPTLGCAFGTDETGGEELWAFVPFDQLHKLNDLLLPQRNDATKVYMLAAPVRFSDVWIDGGWSRSVGVGGTLKTVTGTGVWRTLAFFGRGAGGKFMTGMDVTVSGTVGAHTLDTLLPIVMWNRGNPDVAQPSQFARMGQTWSVPAIGRVVAANFANNDHALFVGSGYSSLPAEGATFFVMSPRNGDILEYFSNMTDGPSTAANPPFRNKLVASPSVHSELTDGRSPLDRTFLGNPAGALTKSVFFPDLHGRIWKYSPEAPSSAPVLFADARAADGADQPFANSLAMMRFYPTPLPSPATSPAPPPSLYVFGESGNDHRVAVRTTSPLFKMYGFRDDGTYPATAYLTREFPVEYRGQVQPATAFVGDMPVVFFAGNKFSTSNAGCISQFDAVLFALNAATNTAAFDLRNDLAAGDDYITIENQRISAIRVAGSRLVVDTGLRANVAPPPPDAPTTGQTSTVGESTATVLTGADPSNAAHAGFRTTTVPYRLGTSTCRANQ